MATIRHKRSTTAGAVPAASALELGELAINVADGKLFVEKSDGSVVCVSAEPGSKGQISVAANGTWSTNANSVPLASLANATAPSVLLGRRSGSAGSVEQITLGSGLSMSGTTLSASGGGSGFSPVTTLYLSSATVTIPAGATTLEIWCASGGAGGGGGCGGAAGTTRGGGGGGAGGGSAIVTIPASMLQGMTVSVTVGAGGAGGAGGTSANGSGGGTGGASSVTATVGGTSRTICNAGLAYSWNTFGRGGSSSGGGEAGGRSGNGQYLGITGSAGGSSTGNYVASHEHPFAGQGGSGGGNVTSANAAGGGGGMTDHIYFGGGLSYINGVTGQDGPSRTDDWWQSGTTALGGGRGGMGGSANASGAGYHGGNAGKMCGGGGGGGGLTAGGNGGSGGQGFVILSWR